MHLTYDIRSHIDPHKIDQFNAEILDVVKRSTRLPVKGGGQRTGWFWGFENRNHPTVSKLIGNCKSSSLGTVGFTSALALANLLSLNLLDKA